MRYAVQAGLHISLHAVDFRLLSLIRVAIGNAVNEFLIRPRLPRRVIVRFVARLTIPAFGSMDEDPSIDRRKNLERWFTLSPVRSRFRHTRAGAYAIKPELLSPEAD